MTRRTVARRLAKLKCECPPVEHEELPIAGIGTEPGLALDHSDHGLRENSDLLFMLLADDDRTNGVCRRIVVNVSPSFLICIHYAERETVDVGSIFTCRLGDSNRKDIEVRRLRSWTLSKGRPDFFPDAGNNRDHVRI
jgi:hypothetical protein